MWHAAVSVVKNGGLSEKSATAWPAPTTVMAFRYHLIPMMAFGLELVDEVSVFSQMTLAPFALWLRSKARSVPVRFDDCVGVWEA